MTVTMPKTQRGQLNVKKALLASAITLLAALLIVGGFLLLRRTPSEEIINPEQFREELIQELTDRQGEYDERSIVLTGTNKATAKKLAEKLGANLRITSDGSFATLTLPEGVTFLDIAQTEEYLADLPKMSIDYEARISEVVEEEESGSDERLPMRPQYTVTDGSYELQTYLDYLNMQNLWKYTTGHGVTVAVIDTGIDTDHPEFAGRISEYSYNATEDKIVKDWLLEDDSYDWSLIEDEQGHGTSVAGVIGASMNSGEIVGIAPEVTLLVIKAECDENGSFKRTSDLVFGLYYAIERNVSVVNMSFGSGDGEAFKAPAQLAFDSDIICVAAAGNDSTANMTYPAADENVFGIGALATDSWELADYSNYGENVDFVAPGTTYTTKMGGGYATTNGTSLACPTAVGVIALYLSQNRYQEVAVVEELLRASCYDLGDLGPDWYYGYGAIDAYALIREDRGTITFNMMTDELDNTEQTFIRNHTLQDMPVPERLYAIFDGWYYDPQCTEEYVWYEDEFSSDLTLYANWVNEEDGIPYIYVELEDGTIEIRAYTGRRHYITIPDYIEGKIVSSIGEGAFEGETRLREVNLPKYLVRIRDRAFLGCSNLIKMSIPDTAKEIGAEAFRDDVRLSSVAFGEYSQLTTIGEYAFSGCGKLRTITLPDQLLSVERFAFRLCTSLRNVSLPASLTSIDGSAFYGDTSMMAFSVQEGSESFFALNGVLLNQTMTSIVCYPSGKSGEYIVPETVKSIGIYAFAYAKTSYVDLANIHTIGEYAFACSRLESLVIPDSVTNMCGQAFACCGLLKKLTLGHGLTEIATDAFFGCSMLQSVEVPNTIQVINIGAFKGTSLQQGLTFEENSSLIRINGEAFAKTRLSSVQIPASVVSIEAYAFSECDALRSVTFESNSNLRTIGTAAFLKSSLCQIILPDHIEKIGARAFHGTKLQTVTLPASLNILGDGVFTSCQNLTDIFVDDSNIVYVDVNGVLYDYARTKLLVYPIGNNRKEYAILDGVTEIAPAAFRDAQKLQHVHFPEGLLYIRSEAFRGVINIDCIDLPSSVLVLDEYCFYKCDVKQYTLSENLQEIKQYAFAKNKYLQTLAIPDSVVEIGKYAFAEDLNLSSVTFTENSKLPRITYGAFAYCGLTSFRVPANVSTIAQGAFSGCSNLQSCTFVKNSKLKSISAYMFDGCSNLRSITFEPGSALTSIQAHGLEGLTKLTSIDFGDAKLTNINNSAFRYCIALSSITLPDALTNIGRFAFYKCMSLRELTIPTLTEHIGSYAFYGTEECNLYFKANELPEYLDEYWDHSLQGYYTGVVSVKTEGDWKYATKTNGNIAIIEYLGTADEIDLTKVNLGGDIETIGGHAFEGCRATSIILANKLLEIQRYAFADTVNLSFIEIPKDVRYIADHAFANSGIGSVTFKGNRISVIEKYAFAYTDQLKSVEIPGSLTKLGSYAFYRSGIETLTFGNHFSMTELSESVFAETCLKSVTIPDSVTLINHSAFRDIPTLKSVKLGKGEDLFIGANAFYNTGIEQLYIPANVGYIGEYAFIGLEKLNAYEVAKDNPYYTAVNGVLYNKDKTKLVAFPAGKTGSFEIPAFVESIGFGAFENTHLSNVTFGKGINLLTIGWRAFYNASNITEITLPESLVSIDYYAFASCKNLTTVNFSSNNSLKGIYEGAFFGCSRLSNITIPDSIVEISEYAFYGCTSLKDIPISEMSGVKGIYDYAFAYTNFKELSVPDTVIDIGNYAFRGAALEKVYIPDTQALMIGIGAFADCNKIKVITVPFIGASFEDPNITWFGYIFGAGASRANATYVPDSLKTVIIHEGITEIPYAAFYQLEHLETIDVPHSVTYIHERAFYGTVAKYTLTNELILDNKPDFGQGLSGHLTVSGVIMPNTFKNCDLLTSATISNDVTNIGESAFAYCTSLTNVTIGSGATNIGESAFAYCTSLTNVTIGSGVASIGDKAFYTCQSLTSIEIPNSVTSIGEKAFCNCQSLTSITIPDSVTKLGSSAFFECTELSNVTIGNGITCIENWLFCECNSLVSVTLSDGIRDIESSAFSGCDSLNMIYNYSDLPITIGSTDYGYIAYNAKMIIDKNGNTTYIQDGNEYILTASNFLFVKTAGTYTLIAYLGTEAVVTLPTDVNGNEYNISELKGVQNLIIPEGITNIKAWFLSSCKSLRNVIISEGVTSIDDYAFYDCSSLISITIPDSVTRMGEMVFGGCSSLTSVTIPNSVTSMEHAMFSGCSSLTNVTLSNSITSINYADFNGCSSLTNIVIPDSVTSIGDCAFSGCQAMANITIPEHVTSIGDNSFKDCTMLKKLHIPASVNQIGLNAFVGCNFEQFTIDENNQHFAVIEGALYDADVTKLLYVFDGVKEITIPSTVVFLSFRGNTTIEKIHFEANSQLTKIEADTFNGCSSLTSITLPDGVTGIGSNAFYGCSSLTSITLPDGIKYIDGGAFRECTSLTNITLPNGVTSIGYRAFWNCKLLTNLIIPDSMTSIGDQAFFSCNSLISITIPDGVTSIGYETFWRCRSLKYVTIGSGVMNIGEGVFDECPIEQIEIDKDNLYITAIDGVIYNAETTKILTVLPTVTNVTIPYGITSIENSLFAECSSLVSITLSDSVTTIGKMAFYNCRSLKSVTMSGSVTSIGSQAFSWCDSLTSITIPNGVTSIGNHAFQYCNSLTGITISDSVTSIGDGAFSGCNSLERIDVSLNNSNYASFDGILYDKKTKTILNLPSKITGEVSIPDGITNIGYAFSGCSLLTSITLPNGLTSIVDGAFSGCNSLTSISIPDSVTSIGSNAFYGCHSLTSVTLGDGVASIGERAFSDCRSLTSVTFGNGVTSIGAYAFSFCSSLTSISIPDSVIRIGENAFCNCDALVNVTISKSVLSIGSYSFSNCDSLVSVTIPESIENIGNGTFADCDSLMKVTIPSSMKNIGNDTFSDCESLYVICNNSDLPITFGSNDNGGVAYYAKMIIDKQGNITYAEDKEACILTESQFLFIRQPDDTYMLTAYLGTQDTITLPQYINGKTYEIKNFKGAQNVIIPDSVTHIGGNAFRDCSSLKSVVVGNGVSMIGYEAFYGCSSLTSVVIGNAVKEIQNYAFYGCTGLTSITIPDNVTHIWGNAFDNCSSLTNVVLGNGITSIEPSVFSGCSSLTDITIPNSVTSIGHRAFYRCTSLKSIIIPDSVQSIVEGAFDYCTLLTEMNIPNSVTTLSISNCDLLTSIHIPNSVTILSISNCDLLTSIHIPDGVTRLSIDNCDLLTSIHIPDGVTRLSIDNCDLLTEIVIPNSVTDLSIGGCTSLTEINIPNSVTDLSIGGCTSLTEINIPNSVTDLSISNCTSLTELIIPNGVTNLSISYCISLTNLIISDSVTKFSINSCYYLESLTIGGGITEIKEKLFSNYLLLNSVTIKNGVTQIGYQAFQNCISLTSITIPDSVKSIGSDVLKGTSYYKNSDNWVDGCLYVGKHLISVDPNVESLVIRPDTISIADDAFYGCYVLKELTIGGDHNYLLRLLTNLETLIITDFPKFGVESYFGGPWDLNLPLTLSKIVLKNSCDVHSGSAFKGITGITIYVEAVKEDSPWDKAYPGWNNGNRVVYGDDWNNVSYYDANGHLIATHQYRAYEVIKPPYMYSSKAKDQAYQFMGWDMDGDGLADALPAAINGDYELHAVFQKSEALYRVEYLDKDGITVLYSYELPYGTSVPVPKDPTKKGYIFLGWNDIPVQVAEDVSITSEWKHSEHGHVFVMKVVAPTCTEQGYTLHTCHICDETTRTDFTDPLGHDYGDWTITKEASCTKPGTMYRECHCGDEETSLIPAAGHNFVEEYKKNSTCKKRGSVTYTCTSCHVTATEELPLAEHEYEKKHTSEPSVEQRLKRIPNLVYGYDENGIYYFKCAHCSELRLYVQTQSASGGIANIQSAGCNHMLSDWQTYYKKTCEEPGVDAQICLLCEQIINLRLDEDLIGQHEKIIHEKQNATCTEIGWEAYETCSRCEYTTYVEIPAAGHNHEPAVIAPTCTERGYTTHTCHCGDSYVDSYVDPLGHRFDDRFTVDEPTCTEEGLERRDCRQCDYFETNVLDATGHDYGSVVTAPTCTEQGYTTHTCHCGDSYVDDYVDTLGHNLGEWYTVTAPTCTENGEEKRVCARCDHFETNVLEATGHSYDAVVTEPACTKRGYTTSTCHCGDSYVDSYVDELGHNYGEWFETKTPTCTELGEERRDCDRCDHFETREIKALGHDIRQHEAQKESCTEHGWEAYETCSRCDYTTYVEIPAIGHDYEAIEKEEVIEHTCSNCGDSYTEDIIRDPVSLTNTLFTTAWGMDFVTSIQTKQPIAKGAKFHLYYNGDVAAFAGVTGSEKVTIDTSVPGELTVKVLEDIAADETLMTLSFTTNRYLSSGKYTLLSVDENSQALCEFTDLIIYQMGDVNLDGSINSRDVLMIKQFVVKMIELTDVQKVYANVYVDTDKDGNPQVSSRDAVLIQQYVVKMPVKLGDRFSITFVLADGETVTYSVCAGETLPAMPATPEGYVWSMSETEPVAPDGAPVSEDTIYYLVRNEGDIL